MRVSIIIPARYGSSRYKGKPLAKILGREMVLRVSDICKNVVGKNNLYVATDSNLIERVVLREGYQVIRTSNKCLTGTDRVAEAAKKIKTNLIINVQGDEPTINPLDIKKIIKAKKKFPNHVICGYDKVHKLEDPSSINLPKIVLNSSNELIYISRSLIPGKKNKYEKINYFKQVCIYAFSQNQLKKFYSNKKSHIEKIEDIEILRFFDYGIKIKMIKLNSNSVAVDEINDIKKAERILLKKSKI